MRADHRTAKTAKKQQPSAAARADARIVKGPATQAAAGTHQVATGARWPDGSGERARGRPFGDTYVLINGQPFDEALRAAGFSSPRHFADYMRLDYGTVNRWRCGRRDIPYWAQQIIALLQEIRLTEEVGMAV